jgi:hypothetical protein
MLLRLGFRVSAAGWMWVAWAHAGVKSPEALHRWVDALGDRSYEAREAATHEVWSAGVQAVPFLETAAKDTSQPERMLRARQLLRNIMLELTPTSDPQVIDWVGKYEKAAVGEKMKLLGLLKGRRAWFPILRLYAAERNEVVKQKVAPMVEGVAQRAARECLRAGEADRAKLALALGPPGPRLWMARAVLHRSQGTLDNEWAQLPEQERSSPWALAILRAAGRVAEARDAAMKAGDKRMGAWMSALEGDPCEWLHVVNPTAEGLEAEYVKLAQRKWCGERISDAEWGRLSRWAMGSEGSARAAATQLLFLLARADLATPALVDFSRLTAFRYLESLERAQDALQAMGLRSENPDYRAWFGSRLEAYRSQEVEQQHTVSDVGEELIAMAGFLERKGMADALWDALAPPLADFAAAEPIPYLDFLSQLFGNREAASGAPLFAARMAAQWAGEEEGRWADVLNSAFGEGHEAREWWDQLEKADELVPKQERLLIQMALYRIGPDPRGLRTRWLHRLVRDAATDHELAGRLFRLALSSDDAWLFSQVEPMVDPQMREELFWGVKIHHLSAADRWNDVAEEILRHMAKQSADGRAYTHEIHVHAYAAAALRLADRAEEAKAQDAIVESCYLGDPSYALRIGHAYAFGRDFARAFVWWKRACVEGGSGEDSDSSQAMKALADAWLQRGDWLRAAALSECLVRLYASAEYRLESPMQWMQLRLQADTARALSRLPWDRDQAIAELTRTHHAHATDGSLADVFFPAVKMAGLVKEHNQWFDQTWSQLRAAIQQFPASDNARNTAAWIASRSVRELDQALLDIQAALAQRPNQAAYLDTMAEVHFAMGKRAKAVEWSSRAMVEMPEDAMIRWQHARFLEAPLPK